VKKKKKLINIPIDMSNETLIALRNAGLIEINIRFRPKPEKLLWNIMKMMQYVMPEGKKIC